jgi:hypothetical protein
MSGPEILIPITFFATIGGIWGYTLHSRHRERMTIIEKGLKPEDMKALYERGLSRTNPLSSLKWGIVFICIGVAVLLGMWLHINFNVEEGVYPALISLMGGLGLISFYAIASRKLQQ